MRRTLWICFLAALPLAALGVRYATSDDQMASIIRQLNAFAQAADQNHDQRLTADEQKALVEAVDKKHGRVWADRVAGFLKSADANHDGVIDMGEWDKAVDHLAKHPPAGIVANRKVQTRTERVAMSDGVRLATDLYLPEGDGPFPVIFTRTPYGRGRVANMATRIAETGIAVVAQDMRGRFDSEGENLPFIGCGWGEHRDGVESVAWIRRQPWSDGKIVTQGGSAGGITQNLLAAADSSGVTAQYISVACASLYHHAGTIGGAFRKADVENWCRDNHFDPKAGQLMAAHPSYDEYWQMFDTSRRFDKVTCPAVYVGGWFDMFAQGTIDSFVGRQHQGGPGARGKQKLVMGPWDHSTNGRDPVGELRFPNASMPSGYGFDRWIAYHLLGERNGAMDEPAVAYYVMGDTSDPQAPGNQWRHADDWPVPAADTPYYFAADGALEPAKPTTADARVQYTFDPANPCPTIGGKNLTIVRGPHDQRKIESRKDVLLFTTPPLTAPLEVTGRVRARIFVATTTPDSDLSVRLCDVYPDGRSYEMAEGMLRLRYRNSLSKPEPMTPGQIVEAEVDCWSTSVIFNRGHRVRVMVTSSNYPRYDANPGTGRLATDAGPQLKQTNRIYCDAGHPSCIVLPVVK